VPSRIRYVEIEDDLKSEAGRRRRPTKEKFAMSEELQNVKRRRVDEKRDTDENEQLLVQMHNDEELKLARAGCVLDVRSNLGMPLEEMKETDRKQGEEIEARKERERAEKAEYICRILKEGSLLTYLRNPKEKINCTEDGPGLATGHVMAMHKQAFFSSSLIGDYQLELTHEAQLFSRRNSPWVHSKAEVEIYVYSLLESLLFKLDLDQLYAVKRKFIEDDYDMVIVRLPDLFPIGFVKVLLPGKKLGDRVFGAFKDEKLTQPGDGYVAGMFDLLVGMKTIGPKHPFALLTNGNKWQLVALDKVLPGESLQTQDAESRGPLKRLQPRESRRRWSRQADEGLATTLLGIVKWIAKPFFSILDEWQAGDREIFVSDAVNVIDGEDEDGMRLGNFLAKVIHLMISSSKDRSDSKPPEIPLRLIDNTAGKGLSNCDVALVGNLPQMDENKYPLEAASCFYLLEPLGSTCAPSFYKALAEDGSTCVIQVFRGADIRNWDADLYDRVLAKARMECRSWDEICGNGRCRVRELSSCGEIHLMVPYLQFVENGGHPARAGSPGVSSKKSAKSLYIASKQSEQQMDAGDDETVPSSPDMSG
jgi:hypothetical protein